MMNFRSEVSLEELIRRFSLPSITLALVPGSLYSLYQGIYRREALPDAAKIPVDLLPEIWKELPSRTESAQASRETQKASSRRRNETCGHI